jgi:hypothetical protein
MRKLALSGAALGAAMAVGTAQAEPLTLSADEMDTVTAGGPAFIDADAKVNLFERIDKDVFITKYKDVFQIVNVLGYFSEANGLANCFSGGGPGCEALTYAITDVNASTGYATSASGAESATGFFGFKDGTK